MEKMQVVVRSMKEEDLLIISELYVRAYKIYSQWEHWNSEAARQLFEHWLKRQPDMSFVAEYDDKVVGAFVGGIKPWWDGNHLVDWELVVDPEYQKKGIGKLLLKVALEKAVEKHNATLCEAVTFKKTKFPLSWYKRIEFNEIKEWTMIGGDIKEVLKKLKK